MSGKEVKHVAVIGAGTAGICAAKYLSADPQLFKPTVFERYGYIGGQWVYTDQTGIDPDGLPVVSGMYKSMRTNVPKSLMHYPDFPYPHDAPEYLSHAEVVEYMKKYVAHFDLNKYIKFKTTVELVEPIHTNTRTRWKVSLKDLRTGNRYSDVFDAVMVCSGVYSSPYYAHILGEETFTGQILHSHDYRKPENFPLNSTIVCLGSGSSAQEIVLDLHKHSEKVYFSHRNDRLTTPLPDNIVQVPAVKHIEGSKVTFSDGQVCEADVIIKCTGYNYSFPFLSSECGITCERRYISPLYKYTIHMDHPSLSFIGLLGHTVHFLQDSIHVQFAIAALKGIVKLPQRKDMEKEVENNLQQRLALGWRRHWENCVGELFNEISIDLATSGDFDPLPAYIGPLKEDVNDLRIVDVRNYRTVQYKVLDDERWCRVQEIDNTIQNGGKNKPNGIVSLDTCKTN